jgi:hypothetical protein
MLGMLGTSKNVIFLNPYEHFENCMYPHQTETPFLYLQEMGFQYFLSMRQSSGLKDFTKPQNLWPKVSR